MKIVPIFAKSVKPENCYLWAVCFSKSGKGNIFEDLFDSWNDTEYLFDFFTDNTESLDRQIWNYTDVDGAIETVMEEAADFERELKYIEEHHSENTHEQLNMIFTQLHGFTITLSGSKDQHRKGKPHVTNPMLRLYGIKLDDGCYVITGGGIKLHATMAESGLEEQIHTIERVQQFLKAEGISDVSGLIN